MTTKEKNCYINILRKKIETSPGDFRIFLDEYENGNSILTEKEYYTLLNTIKITNVYKIENIFELFVRAFLLLNNNEYIEKTLKNGYISSAFDYNALEKIIEKTDIILKKEVLQVLDPDQITNLFYILIKKDVSLDILINYLNDDSVANKMLSSGVLDKFAINPSKDTVLLMGTKTLSKIYTSYEIAELIDDAISMDKRVESTYDILSKFNVSYEKNMFILDCISSLSMIEKNKVRTLLYKNNKNVKDEVNRIYIKACKEFYSLDGNHLIKDLFIDLCCSYLDYENEKNPKFIKTFKTVYLNSNLKISPEFFGILFTCLGKYISNEKGLDISIYPISSLRNFAAEAFNDDGTHTIHLNYYQLGDTFQTNFSGHYLYVLFHEIRHIEQLNPNRNSNLSIINLKSAKDYCIYQNHPEYYETNIHDIMSFEVDADIHGIAGEKKFLKKLGLDSEIMFASIYEQPVIYTDYLSLCNKNNIRRINNRELSIDSVFDKVLSKENIASLQKIYPILKYEYSKDGDKIPFDDIIDLYNLYKDIGNKQMEVFYLKIIKNILTSTIQEKKLERENKYLFLLL